MTGDELHGISANGASDTISVPQEVDMVNQPPHYKVHSLECIDEMIAVFGPIAVIRYCGITAWKYRYRFQAKGNPEQDEAKAEWYIKKAAQLRKEFGVYDD